MSFPNLASRSEKKTASFLESVFNNCTVHGNVNFTVNNPNPNAYSNLTFSKLSFGVLSQVHYVFIDQACSVKMAGYWPHSFCMFMDRDEHAKKELGQYPAILTSHLVSNPYLSPKLLLLCYKRIGSCFYM